AQAVEAMRAGAYDYLVKPFSLDHAGLLLARVLEVQKLKRENRRLRRAVDEPVLLESASPLMLRALDTARQAAGSDVTVLLTGESGTGKNVLASAIHGWSPRQRGAFVTVACTTLAEHLCSRLNVIPIRRPALRGRPEDLPALIDHVLATLCSRHRRPALSLAPEARRALHAYRWPGNVRELVNTLERAVVLSRGDVIQGDDLPDRLLAPDAGTATPEAAAATPLSLHELERRHIEQVLADAATLEEAAARL